MGNGAWDTLRAEAAEAIGAFFLVLVGGAAIVTGQSAPLVALAFGAAVMVLVQALGHVCGAHFNPAVTLAFTVTGHFPARRAPSYVLAQVLGAVAACLLLAGLGDVGPVVAAGRLDGAAAFVVEALATSLLAFVIVAVATDPRVAPGTAGLAIGATVAIGSLVAGPLTGAAMNPARALAPALVANAPAGLAAHLAGPFAGAVLGMAAYEAVRRGRRPRAEEAALGATGPIDLEAKA